VIFPLYGSIRAMHPQLMPAARSLGASQVTAFLRVQLPLTLPGLMTGAALVFVLALGYFVTPTLLGGRRDLMIAKIARDFGKYGIEPRHMRMYRHFADREAGLFQQAVVPHRGASNDSKRRAVQSLNDLAKMSKRLKQLLLRSSLREHLQR